MSGTSTRLRAPAPMRLSTVKDCALRAALEASGADARGLSPREERIMLRGRELGRTYAKMLAAGARANGGKWRIYVASGDKGEWPANYLTDDRDDAAFLAELKVPWALGQGHVDLYAVETDTVIEVLSSMDASPEMVDAKLKQAVAYCEHIDAATGVCLRIVNPSDLSEEQVIVLRGDARYEEHARVVQARLSAVKAWTEGGALPECSGVNAWFCRFDECACKQPAPPLEEVDTPDARAAALAFAQAKHAESAAKATYDQAKAVREDVQARLVDLVPVGKIAVGPYVVHRIHYKGRETFKLALAEKDSRIPSDLLAEFVKVGDPYDVVKIDRVSDDPALTADSFGDVAPWTDADLVTP